jgi:hypothetical protein
LPQQLLAQGGFANLPRAGLKNQLVREVRANAVISIAFHGGYFATVYSLLSKKVANLEL